MPSLPPPPVPQGLREMFKEYPGHILRLQESLNRVTEKPSKGTPPFEVAIWMLEGCLESFIAEAREGFEAAEASGDPVAIERAEQELSLMFRSRSPNGGMKGLKDLLDYFEGNKKALQ